MRRAGLAPARLGHQPRRARHPLGPCSTTSASAAPPSSPSTARPDGEPAPAALDDAAVAALTGLGYNPAVEARGFTPAQARAVRSRHCASDWALQDTQKKVDARF